MISSRARLALALAVTVVSMAACSDSKDSNDQETPAASDSESRAPSGDNGSLANPVGARADLTDFSCATTGQKRWAASGTIVNNADEDASYLVRVSVIVTDTSEVVVSRDKELEVAAAGREKFTFNGLRGRTGDGLECAARVVRSAPR